MWVFNKSGTGGSWLGLYYGSITWTRSAGTDYIASSSVSDNTWYLGTVTFNNGNLNLYIDNNNVGTWSGVTLTTTTGSNTIGTNAFGESFKGNLDEVAFWNRTLTPAEIATLYNNGSGLSLIS